MAIRQVQFHVTATFGLPEWAGGCFSVYEVDGDTIAKRVRFNDAGEPVWRDGWPGFIDCFSTLEQALQVMLARCSVEGVRGLL